MRRFNGLFIFGLIALGLIFVGSISPIRIIRNQARQIFTPLTRSIYQTSNFGFRTITTISQIENLLTDNNNLKSKNSKLQAEIISLKEKIVTDKNLEKQYKIDGGNTKLGYQAATIVGRSPSIQRDILNINKGSKVGVKINQPVMSGGFLIGKISQVMPSSSQIELITNSRFIIPVILQNSRKAGLLRGGLKGLIIEQLPVDAEITPKEAVVTSGLARELPEGLPVGLVGETVSKSSDIFKSVLLESPIDISSIETVFILESK